MLFKPMDKEREIPEENAPTTNTLTEEDALTVASPSTSIISVVGPSPWLEGRELLHLCY